MARLDGGRAQADIFCQAEAVDAGLSGTYLALLSTVDGGAATSRFDTVGGAWTRLDGAALKPTAADMLALDGGPLHCALNVTASGAYVGTYTGYSVWGGAPSPTSPGLALATCGGSFTNPNAFASGTGVVDTVAPTVWFDFAALGTPCSAPHHLYCLQH